MTDLLLTGIGHLTTNLGAPIEQAAVAISDGVIEFAGAEADAPDQGGGRRIDCAGRAVIPGFVDAHTHLVFAGDRSEEFTSRLGGEPYTGGGILSTVESTRAASEERLYELAADRVRHMIANGTTTVEIKSGYGLDVETEMRLLTVASRLGETLPVTVKTTFLGAHTVPSEFQSDREGYVDLVMEEMLPRAARVADYCDVFVEEGVFSIDEAERIFTAASSLGLLPRVHADQLTHSGGARLAARIGATSADHLDHVTEEDARVLAEAGVSAVLVPGASYSLRSPQAPGPMLWAAGCNVAVATDCNPGTSYVEAMGFVISLAVVQMGLTVDQALWAATRGGALSLGLEDRGMVTEGMRADLVVLDAPSPAHIPYRPATSHVGIVIQDGELSYRKS